MIRYFQNGGRQDGFVMATPQPGVAMTASDAAPEYQVTIDHSPEVDKYIQELARSKSAIKQMFPDVPIDKLTQASIAILKRESNYGKAQPSLVNNFIRQAVRKVKGLDESSKSTGLSKFKMSSLSPQEQQLLNIKDLNNPEDNARATLYNMAINYQSYYNYDKDRHNYTEDDMLNFSILAHNQGARLQGYTDGNLDPQKMEYLRSLADPNTKIKDVNSTNYKHVPLIGQQLYDWFGHEATPYIAAARTQMNSNIKPIENQSQSIEHMENYPKSEPVQKHQQGGNVEFVRGMLDGSIQATQANLRRLHEITGVDATIKNKNSKRVFGAKTKAFANSWLANMEASQPSAPDQKTSQPVNAETKPKSLFGDFQSSYTPWSTANSGQFTQDGKAYVYDPKTKSYIPTEECAQWANSSLRGYKDAKGRYLYSNDDIGGDAWTRIGAGKETRMVFNGYDGMDYDRQKYSRRASDKRNNEAAANLAKNFDSNSLDKSKTYMVNMYYAASPNKQKAWEGASSYGTTGTHTGNLYWDENKNKWIVAHNIHGKVYEDDFLKAQGPNKAYGVTAIAEAPARNYDWGDEHYILRHFTDGPRYRKLGGVIRPYKINLLISSSIVGG